MFGREKYQDYSMEEKYSSNNPNNDDDQDEAEEEALSLCDLPIYGSDDADWENFSKEDQSLSSSSSSSSDQDLFEFFSENWSSNSNSSNYPVDENIVFCGKLILSKEPVSINTTNELERNKEENEKPQKKGWLSRKKRSSKSVSLPVSYKYGHRAEKSGGNYGFPVQRVSTMVAVPAKKLRWNLMMFGLARSPSVEMELSDIRSRQSRQSKPAMFEQRGGGDEKVSGGGKGRWWAMIRALGCGGGSHAKADVSF
ncbi:unnamed protein product [Camellia sinensis]